MEILIIAAIVIAIMLILGMSALSMVETLMYIMFGITSLMLVFFVLSGIMLVMSQRRRGSFSRFEKRSRFESAVYEIDGKEYVNHYPAETFLRNRIYTPGKRTLFLFGRKKPRFVFDMHTVLIIIAGLILSAAGAFMMYEMIGIVKTMAVQ